MRTVRSMLAAAGAAVALALSACGGGEGVPDGAAAPSGLVLLDTARTVRAIIGTAGGTVSATAADGRVYTLSVPAGALAANTEITATPVISMGGAPLSAGVKGAVRFGPSGLGFGHAATLRIEGAATTVTTGKRRLGYVRSDDGTALEFVLVELVGNALEIRVSHFSDVVVTDASPDEVNAIPPAPISDPVLAMRDAAVRGFRDNPDDDMAMLAQLHDQMLLPLLTRAEALVNVPSQDSFHESVAATFAEWVRLVDIVIDFGGRADRLGDRMAQSRARAGGILRGQVEVGRTACLAPPPITTVQIFGLNNALWAQKVAQLNGLDAADLGLDADTVARRMNDCARVAFVPRPAPTFEVGRPVSLDSRLELIYAGAPNTSGLTGLFGFDVTVSSGDAAVASPQGTSNNQDEYTTVVTPRVANPLFDVRGCLLTFLSNFASVPSVMCGTHTVGGSTAIVLSGELRFSEVSADSTQSLMYRLRVRLEADGSLTVLEATGQESIQLTFRTQCFKASENRNVEVTTFETTTATVTSGRIVPASPGNLSPIIELLGSRVTSLGRLSGLPDCSVVTSEDRRELVRVIGPTRIERDERGPTAIVFGALGRLVRE